LLKLISVVALVMAPALVDKNKIKTAVAPVAPVIETVQPMEAPAEQAPAAEQTAPVAP
jgi:hypothetical protein